MTSQRRVHHIGHGDAYDRTRNGLYNHEWKRIKRVPRGFTANETTELINSAIREGAPLYVLDELIPNGFNLDAKNRSNRIPLGTAIDKVRLDAVRYLLDHGASPNTKDGSDNMRTPLFLATSASTPAAFEVLKLLLERGGRPEVRDDAGMTVLHFAAFRSRGETIELLCRHGAEVNSRSNSGEAPLHRAAVNIWQDKAPIPELIKAGADVNAQDHHGRTPLHATLDAEQELFNPYAVRMLLAGGARFDIQDNTGKTFVQALEEAEASLLIRKKDKVNRMRTFLNQHLFKTAGQRAESLKPAMRAVRRNSPGL